MSRRSALPCGRGQVFLVLSVAMVVAGVGCTSDDAPTSTPTSAPAVSSTTARSTAPTRPHPSASARSKALCTAITARLASAAATLPSASFQAHRVVFADHELTGRLLTARDAFYEQLSPLDRQILAVADTPVGDATLDARLRAAALDWAPGEIDELRAALTQAEQAAAAAGVTFKLPATIYLAKESETIYSGSLYTRCAAVFMPGPMPASILIHELFHIMSRYNPQIRGELYALVGYRPCRVDRSALGADLAAIVITNPDTDAFGETCITLPTVDGTPTTYVPLLVGIGDYDGTPEGWTSILVPILVELDGGRPVVIDGTTQYREMVMADYARAVGENGISEPFHPDELIALNLQQALTPGSFAASEFPNEQLVRDVGEALASL